MTWQPIETAPKDWKTVIDLWSDGARYPDCRWNMAFEDEYHGWEQRYSETRDGWHDRRDLRPTHWMPLPEPPK